MLLERAGFSSVRTEEVPVLFELPGVDEYLDLIADYGRAARLGAARAPPALTASRSRPR